MDSFDEFEQILMELDNMSVLTSEITEKLVKIFSVERFLSAMEKITLNQISKYVFKPSGRILWTVNGKNHDYLIYPKRYCTCMDFNLQSIAKNIKYLCKHLIAQALYEHLDKENFENADLEIEIKDKEFDVLYRNLIKN